MAMGTPTRAARARGASGLSQRAEMRTRNSRAAKMRPARVRIILDVRAGFGSHPHRDMEILTYVLEGALEHRDTLGTTSVIRPGEVQRMTAGTGIRHSEFNPSPTEPLHLLQIWLVPERRGLTSGYEQKAFPEAERRGKLRIVASPDGRAGSVNIHQDALVRAALLEPGEKVSYPLPPGRHAWVQVARGTVELNGQTLREGDGAAVSDEDRLDLTAKDSSEVLLFDLA